jgi:hypothetical protein
VGEDDHREAQQHGFSQRQASFLAEAGEHCARGTLAQPKDLFSTYLSQKVHPVREPKPRGESFERQAPGPVADDHEADVLGRGCKCSNRKRDPLSPFKGAH